METAQDYNRFVGGRTMDVTSNSAVREAYHRCSNDLQMMVSLLQLSARRSDEPRTRETLTEVANRVGVLIHARAALVHHRGRQPQP